jgi:hypothetical protein
MKFASVVACLFSLALAVNPYKKFVKIDGVTKLNPVYTRWWEEEHGAKASLTPTEASKLTLDALTIVTNMATLS